MSRLSISLLAALSATGCVEYQVNSELGYMLGRYGCSLEDIPAPDPTRDPVSECDASVLEAASGEKVELFHNTTDPNDLDLIGTYWDFVDRPEGSASQVQEGADGSWYFRPDLLGTYELEVSSINEECRLSEPCTVTVHVAPEQDLWVEMFWEHPGDDMDLHLVLDEPGRLYETDRDCYYGNCTPDMPLLSWGDPNSYADDPSLDFDDIEGTGPENINIYTPSESSYRVVVHDFPASVHMGANRVTVRVYLSGELAYEESKNIRGEDKYVEFARIDWANQVVEPL